MSHNQPQYARHGARLYRGDCRAACARMKSASVDFIFTDPPYGSNQNEGDHNATLALKRGHKVQAIRGDGPDEAADLVRWLITTSRRLLKPGGFLCCCCHGGGSKQSIQHADWALWMAEELEFEQAVVWDKGPMGLGWRYRRSYEFVLVAKKPGKARWFDTSHRVENVIRPGAYGIRRTNGRTRRHPTEKPRALAEHFIRLHTQAGDKVLDPFAGAGSTLAAAVALGRRAVGVELDARWRRQAVKAIEEAAQERRRR